MEWIAGGNREHRHPDHQKTICVHGAPKSPSLSVRGQTLSTVAARSVHGVARPVPAPATVRHRRTHLRRIMHETSPHLIFRGCSVYTAPRPDWLSQVSNSQRLRRNSFTIHQAGVNPQVAVKPWPLVLRPKPRDFGSRADCPHSSVAHRHFCRGAGPARWCEPRARPPDSPRSQLSHRQRQGSRVRTRGVGPGRHREVPAHQQGCGPENRGRGFAWTRICGLGTFEGDEHVRSCRGGQPVQRQRDPDSPGSCGQARQVTVRSWVYTPSPCGIGVGEPARRVRAVLPRCSETLSPALISGGRGERS